MTEPNDVPQEPSEAASVAGEPSREPAGSPPSLVPPRRRRSFLDRARSRVAVSWQHRGEKKFFRAVKRAASSSKALEQVLRLREHILLSRMRLAKSAERGLVVGLTGPQGGEGASATSLLLALALADCVNLRVSLLGVRFDASRFSILTQKFELAKNSVDVHVGPHRVLGYCPPETHNLTLLTAVTGEELGVDFFSTDDFVRLVDHCKSNFDVTLVDLPPMRKDSSSVFALPHVDELVLVAEAGKTRLDDLNHCVHAAEETGATVGGVVLNKQTAPFWSRLIWGDFFY